MRPAPFRRYALATVGAELIPIPLVDTLVQNHVRRRAVRRAGRLWGIPLTNDEIEAIADEDLGTASRIVGGIVFWPLKKLLRTLFFVFTLRRMWKARADFQRRLTAVMPEGRVAPAPADSQRCGRCTRGLCAVCPRHLAATE